MQRQEKVRASALDARLAAYLAATAGAAGVVGAAGETHATVVSNSGKRTEKVVISKQAAQYFAQREGEPSIYELDSKAVEELQKAAADVKEAPPEQPKKK